MRKRTNTILLGAYVVLASAGIAVIVILRTLVSFA